MARYYYDHSVGAQIKLDEEGTVCGDDRAAMNHAYRSLPSVAIDTNIILPWQHFELIVRREDGQHIGRVGMTIAVETQNPSTAASLALQKMEGSGKGLMDGM